MSTARPAPFSARTAAAVLLLLFLGMGMWLLAYGMHAGWTDATTLKARRALAKTKTAPDPVAWLEYRNRLSQAAADAPDNPEFHDYLAYLYANRGYLLHRVDQPADEYFTTALMHARRSAQLRPASPFAWAAIAQALHYLNREHAAMWQAFDLAREFGPNEPAVQTQLAELGYQRAPELSAPRRAFLAASYRNAAQPTRATLASLASRHGVDPETLQANAQPYQ